MRHLIPVLSVLAVAACESPEAGSQSGVGFQSYSEYLYQQQIVAEREAAQRRAAMAQAAAAPAPAVAAPAPTAPAASVAADTMAALNRSEPTGGQPLSALAPAGQPAAAPVAAPAPAPVPVAPAPAAGQDYGSNVAAFALATSHPVGQQMYSRTSPFRQAALDRACARYASDALAQEAFLQAGGPERDRLNLDPDGDGYACRWDPAPFRLARQGG